MASFKRYRKNMKKEKAKQPGYQVFARKFRPENFEEVVGQDTVTQILRNAVKTGRIPQSFLFAGPRGVGKTSTARILAKALNCIKKPEPTDSPCGTCEICQEITRANSLDVLEIDGASNRGIEEIRTLRENVKFKPAGSRFKIYIIDEVHMLTGEAFNALLKTLEEPPEHVKFIFATTEPHKVPLTILSRCQRFNFKRIPADAIAEKIREIAKAEGLKADEKALYLIARASDGSLRDAETLLDQLGALSEGKIREEDVLLALGLAGSDTFLELLAALQKKDAKKILSLIEDLYEAGKDFVQFGRGLFELFRNLLLLQIGQGAESFIELGPESKKDLEQFKNIFSREELLLILSLLQNLQGDLRRALAPPKLLIEIAFLKLLHLEGLHAVKELMGKAEESSRGMSLPGQPRLDTGRNPVASKKNSNFAEADNMTKSHPERSGTSSSAAKPRGSCPPKADPPLAEDPSAASRLQDDAARQMASPVASFSLDEIEKVWPQVVEAVKAKEMSTGMFLAEAEPVEVSEEGVIVGLPEEFNFHKEMLERPEKRRMIEGIFTGLLGREAKIQFVTTRLFKEEVAAQKATAKNPAEDPSKLPDIVRQAMDVFQGSKIIRTE